MNWQTGTPTHNNYVLIWTKTDQGQQGPSYAAYRNNVWVDHVDRVKPNWVEITHWCEIIPPTQ